MGNFIVSRQMDISVIKAYNEFMFSVSTPWKAFFLCFVLLWFSCSFVWGPAGTQFNMMKFGDSVDFSLKFNLLESSQVENQVFQKHGYFCAETWFFSSKDKLTYWVKATQMLAQPFTGDPACLNDFYFWARRL